VGTWNKRIVDRATGEVEPSIVRMRCGRCGEEYKVACRTGNVRGWVNKFAKVHFHGDPLDPKQVTMQAQAAARRRG